MSDEMNDLRTLVTGADGKESLKDKNGILHALSPLTLTDIVEFEDEMGMSIFDMIGKVSLKQIAYLIYICLRKEGLSPDAIKAKRFRSKEEVLDQFDFGALPDLGNIYFKILKISGLRTKQKEDQPENPPQPVGQGG